MDGLQLERVRFESGEYRELLILESMASEGAFGKEYRIPT